MSSLVNGVATGERSPGKRMPYLCAWIIWSAALRRAKSVGARTSYLLDIAFRLRKEIAVPANLIGVISNSFGSCL
jgi:hypothetical protein